MGNGPSSLLSTIISDVHVRTSVNYMTSHTSWFLMYCNIPSNQYTNTINHKPRAQVQDHIYKCADSSQFVFER